VKPVGHDNGWSSAGVGHDNGWSLSTSLRSDVFEGVRRRGRQELCT
jgi:hypothetical protein